MNQFFQKVCTTAVCILCFVGMQISLASMNEAYAGEEASTQVIAQFAEEKSC